jgi:hypothetical protein
MRNSPNVSLFGSNELGVATRVAIKFYFNDHVRRIRCKCPSNTRDFVDDMRELNVTPHIAQNTSNRSSSIDARTTRHPGFAINQQKRKRTEEPFGWGKTIGGLARRVSVVGRPLLTRFDMSRLESSAGIRPST